MTSIWKRIVDEHRTLVIPIAIALAVNIAGYILVVNPRGQKAAGAADRATRAATALAAAQRDEALARALVTGKAEADRELADFYQKIVPPSLASANRMTYASLPALARRTSVKFQARSSGLDDQPETGGLGHLQIHMVLQGDYQSLRRFIYQLETAPEFVIIDDVTLTEEAAGTLTLLIDLSTYFAKGSNATD